MTDTATLLSQEWLLLQDQHEHYERNALLIKTACLALFVIALCASLNGTLTGAIVVLFWIQEGITKTFQGRIADRLLRVESLMRQTPAPRLDAMQFHSEWNAKRRHGVGLIAEYITSACRPTVAFPYLPLLLVFAIQPLLA